MVPPFQIFVMQCFIVSMNLNYLSLENKQNDFLTFELPNHDILIYLRCMLFALLTNKNLSIFCISHSRSQNSQKFSQFSEYECNYEHLYCESSLQFEYFEKLEQMRVT